MNTPATFATRSQVVPLRDIISPNPVLTQPVRLSFDPSCRASIDAFADEMMRKERQHMADIAAESTTEAQRFQSRPNPHCD